MQDAGSDDAGGRCAAVLVGRPQPGRVSRARTGFELKVERSQSPAPGTNVVVECATTLVAAPP